VEAAFLQCAQVLEARAMLSAVLPELTVTKATTLDAKSVAVTYTIANANIGQSLRFDVYRSDQPFVDGTSKLIGTQIINPASNSAALAQGSHVNVKLIAGTALPPNQSLPYIVVVADGDNNVAEDPASTNVAYFHTFVLGAVAHGFNSTSSTTTPTWETRMANELLTVDHYDTVIAFNWMATAGLKKSGQAVAAGDQLYSQIVVAADNLAAGHAGDVVDLHLIGHSRGAVVVNRALRDLVGTTDPALKGSYIRETLLDPHPAGSSTLSLYSANPSTSFLVVPAYRQMEQAMADPQITIPTNVSVAEVYYQHSVYSGFRSSNSTEFALNLWGEGPNNGIVNQSAAAIQWHNLTGVVDATIGPSGRAIGLIGHSEITDWYEMHIVVAGVAILAH
jgi:hypothetical protein